ncbi:hypothetical protein [Trinickia terrae]|nr:hypothetical protein [Trinickia terrae]
MMGEGAFARGLDAQAMRRKTWTDRGAGKTRGIDLQVRQAA